MIEFACKCGEKFEVPQSAAGDQFQCPNCMRLVDVPQLSDIGNLADDGTFNMYELEPAPSELYKKMAMFSGKEDIRGDVDEFLAIGVKTEDLAPTRREHGPRYDPETGERVMPVEIREDPVMPLLPSQMIPTATPVLGYASALQTPDVAAKLLWWQMPWRLVSGVNLVAMGFVFFAHLAVQIALAIPFANFMLSPFILFAVPMVIAHYCNTMEDFGANHRDRVPVMFRNGSVGEDLLRPLFYVFISKLVAFAPLAAVGFAAAWFPFQGSELAEVILGWVGLFLLPAFLFTGLNSGAIENLAPWRALSVIRVAPMRYLWAATAFAVAVVAYILAFQNFTVASITMLSKPPPPAVIKASFMHGLVAIALQAAAIYLMHLGAAWMGLIYRSHYEKLNWVLQRHVKRERTDTAAKLAEMRRTGDPRLRPTKQVASPPQPKAVLPVEALPIEPASPSGHPMP